MKIAVTSMGEHLDDQVDPRFGRAKYILIIDTADMHVDVVDNSSNMKALKGAGIQAASMLGERQAEVLLTGYCGPNAFKTLKAAGIHVVNDVGGNVRDALEKYTAGGLEHSEEPNVEGHW